MRVRTSPVLIVAVYIVAVVAASDGPWYLTGPAMVVAGVMFAVVGGRIDDRGAR